MNYGYDRVSSIYDRLSGLIFGDKLQKAQSALLPAIMPADQVLIVGGGSGWILEAISRLHPYGLTITYVDASAKMIGLSRKRNREDNKVTFIAAPIENVQLSTDYDVIITPFLFDNFQANHATIIFNHLHKALRNNGQWLYTDFCNSPRLTHRILLKSMYLFFRKTCGIKANALPGMENQFKQHAYRIVKRQLFINGFAEAVNYEKDVDKKHNL